MFKVMRKVFMFLFLTSSLIRGQESTETIDKLENSKKEILSKMNLSKDSIRKIDLIINRLQFENFQKITSDSTVVAVAIKNGKIKKTPDVMGEVILTLEEDKKIIIKDYHNDYFSVCTDSICGYMSYNWIRGNELELSKFIRTKKLRDSEVERTKYEIRKKEKIEEDALIEKVYLKKYGKVVYDKLQQGYYWIGMTDEMALISLSNPIDINRSVGSWGVHEQWVYNGLYLYFEDGELKSYQK